MQHNKPLCYAPFIGMYANSTNKYAPCCVSKKIKASSPVSFWSSNEIKSIRTSLLNNVWPDSCLVCKNLYEKNLTYEIDHWESEFKKNNVDIDIELGNQHNHPIILDYRPSNICNLKCRMCVPHSSSQWETEIQQNYAIVKWFDPVYKTTDNFNIMLAYILSIKLRKIKILGGEPTIDPNVLTVLENVSNNYDVLPALRFTTNATNITKKFKNTISKFLVVDISFSVDGITDTFEYIRTNAHWNIVRDTIINMFVEYPTIQYSFNTVITPYNIFNIKSLLMWYYELYNTGYRFSVNFFTSSDQKTSINAVLPNDLDFLKTDISSWIQTIDLEFSLIISGLLPILNSAGFDEVAYNDFINYNSDIDNIRHTKLISISPNFNNYINNTNE